MEETAETLRRRGAGRHGVRCGTRSTLAAVWCLLITVQAPAEESAVFRKVPVADPARLTGNLRVDFFGATDPGAGPARVALQEQDGMPAWKSPWLAAGMSLVLPGAGEFYAESYWKSALFLAIEVTAWSVAYSQDKKGDRQTDFYQDYARRFWSPRKYAQWTLDNARDINASVNPAGYQDVLVGDDGVNWDRLNQLERDLGGWYSHALPPFGDQQYYELIGKYQQFYQGWEDADPSLLTYAEITARLAGGTTRFTSYSAERGKANDFYSTASTAVTIAVLNHIVSALDAAWSAGSYNGMHASVGMQAVPIGDRVAHVPVAKLSYGF